MKNFTSSLLLITFGLMLFSSTDLFRMQKTASAKIRITKVINGATDRLKVMVEESKTELYECKKDIIEYSEFWLREYLPMMSKTYNEGKLKNTFSKILSKSLDILFTTRKDLSRLLKHSVKQEHLKAFVSKLQEKCYQDLKKITDSIKFQKTVNINSKRGILVFDIVSGMSFVKSAATVIVSGVSLDYVQGSSVDGYLKSIDAVYSNLISNVNQKIIDIGHKALKLSSTQSR